MAFKLHFACLLAALLGSPTSFWNRSKKHPPDSNQAICVGHNITGGINVCVGVQ